MTDLTIVIKEALCGLIWEKCVHTNKLFNEHQFFSGRRREYLRHGQSEGFSLYAFNGTLANVLLSMWKCPTVLIKLLLLQRSRYSL